jgi:hypothetical protein
VPLEATATSCVRPVDPSSVKTALDGAGRVRAGGLRLSPWPKTNGRAQGAWLYLSVKCRSDSFVHRPPPFAQSRCVLSRRERRANGLPHDGLQPAAVRFVHD